MAERHLRRRHRAELTETEQSGTAVARLGGGQPGYRPDQHVRVRTACSTVAGTRVQQLTMTSSPGVNRMSTGQGRSTP